MSYKVQFVENWLYEEAERIHFFVVQRPILMAFLRGLILGLMLFYACTTFNILRINRMECALSKFVDDTKLKRGINTLQGRIAFQRNLNRL